MGNFNINNGGLLLALCENTTETKFYIIYIGFILLTMVVSYLLGSINTAIIVSKTLYRDDIRRHGSGNAGMTNMLRTYGKGAAGLTLLGDLLKTVIALLFAGILFGFGYVAGIATTPEVYIAGLFAVIGHIFPIYYRMKGGKGVLATASMTLVLCPIGFLILFAVFALLVYTTRYVSLGSVVGSALLPVVFYTYVKVVFSEATQLSALASLSLILIAVLIVFAHRANLVRISEKTENKLSFGKKKEQDDNEGDEK